MTITRFAPSPTGTLHIGNVRTALHNYLFAKRHGGRFMLRIDDTDLVRSKEEHVDAIRADLAWLGLNPDGEVRQSARFDLYEREFEKLKAAGRVYACYETPEELDLRRKILLGRGLPPVYERKDPDAPIPEGRTPHWRFKLDHDAPIEWDDLVRGPQKFDPKLLSDPVVRRGDGSWLYLLPSVIDDIDMAITHVVRGEDHVTNTATQVQMFAALGSPVPAFAHEALLTGTEGKLSKRLGSTGMAEFREMGIEPIAIAALLAKLGTSDPIEPVTSLAPLIESIDFGHFGRAPARFDETELAALNARILHMTDYDAVAARLPAGMNADAWQAVRGNINTLADVAEWWTVIAGEIVPTIADEDRAFIAEAAEFAEMIDWDIEGGKEVWSFLCAKLKTTTDRKGKALFLPLRRALTGHDHGPEMAALLPLIGKARAIKRLQHA
jgi:glutamyl-tRNA synthetase